MGMYYPIPSPKYFSFLDFLKPKVTEHNISFDLTISPCPPSRPAFPSKSPLYSKYLPLELVIVIMETARVLEDGNAVDTLRACSLVCREWSLAAQKLLFTCVSLHSQSACEAFCAAVDPTLERGRILANSVQSVTAVLDYSRPCGLHQLSFAHAITLCPQLRQLDLSLYNCGLPGKDNFNSPDLSRMQRRALCFDDETIAVLKSGPSITSLQFNNWSNNCHSLAQLLDVWPSITSLSISGTPPELSSPFSGQLRSVNLNFQTSPSSHFLQWLLLNSSDTLRNLRLERDIAFDVFEYLIERYGASLTSLSFPSCSYFHGQLMTKCPKLESFGIENPLLSPIAIRNLPSELQSLAFTLDKDTALPAIVELVKSNRNLNTVMVHLWHGAELHPQYASLQIACASRGVDLKSTNNVVMFRRMIRKSSA